MAEPIVREVPDSNLVVEVKGPSGTAMLRFASGDDAWGAHDALLAAGLDVRLKLSTCGRDALCIRPAHGRDGQHEYGSLSDPNHVPSGLRPGMWP